MIVLSHLLATNIPSLSPPFSLSINGAIAGLYTVYLHKRPSKVSLTFFPVSHSTHLHLLSRLSPLPSGSAIRTRPQPCKMLFAVVKFLQTTMYYTIYHVSACILCFYLMLWLFKLIGGGLRREPKTVPLSVNYHFTRKCNCKLVILKGPQRTKRVVFVYIDTAIPLRFPFPLPPCLQSNRNKKQKTKANPWLAF